jgi:hypothetical protein
MSVYQATESGRLSVIVLKRQFRNVPAITWREQVHFQWNAACLAEKQQIMTNFIVFGFTQPRLEHTIYCNRGDHANHYVTEAVLYVSIQ